VGFGGLLGAFLVDLFQLGALTSAQVFGSLFLIDAAIFIASALMAARIMARPVSTVIAIPKE
jgi:hypothetical protein